MQELRFDTPQHAAAFPQGLAQQSQCHSTCAAEFVRFVLRLLCLILIFVVESTLEGDADSQQQPTPKMQPTPKPRPTSKLIADRSRSPVRAAPDVISFQRKVSKMF